MGLLSSEISDGLAEIFKLGNQRASEVLTRLLGCPITVNVQDFYLRNKSQLSRLVRAEDTTTYFQILQRISGKMNMDVVYIFSEHPQNAINSKVEFKHRQNPFELGREGMSEIGNVIINAYLSSMAQMLEFDLDSSLPSFYLNNPNGILTNILSKPEHTSFLMLNTEINIKEQYINGNLIFVLSQTSLNTLEHLLSSFLECLI